MFLNCNGNFYMRKHFKILKREFQMKTIRNCASLYFLTVRRNNGPILQLRVIFSQTLLTSTLFVSDKILIRCHLSNSLITVPTSHHTTSNLTQELESWFPDFCHVIVILQVQVGTEKKAHTFADRPKKTGDTIPVHCRLARFQQQP